MGVDTGTSYVSWWTKTITIWTVIGVLVAIVAAYIAHRAWHG
jgi:hypothetical protein